MASVLSSSWGNRQGPASLSVRPWPAPTKATPAVYASSCCEASAQDGHASRTWRKTKFLATAASFTKMPNPVAPEFRDLWHLEPTHIRPHGPLSQQPPMYVRFNRSYSPMSARSDWSRSSVIVRLTKAFSVSACVRLAASRPAHSKQPA